MQLESLWLIAIASAGIAVLLTIVTKMCGSLPMHTLLYSAVWAPCLFLSQVALGGAMRPNLATTIILFGAWWAFLLGSIVPLIGGHIRRAGKALPIQKWPAMAILYMLVGLQWAGVLYEVLHMQGEGRSLGSSTIVEELIAMRVNGVTSEIHLPLFLGSFRWSFVIYIPLALMLRANRFISRRHLIGVFALAGLSALSHFTRAPLVQLSIVTLVAWLVLYRPPRRVLWAASLTMGGALLVAFIVSQIAIDRESSTTASLEQSLNAYFGMSPLGYEEILEGRYPREPGFYSLEWLYFPLKKIGMIEGYPGLSRPYIYYPVVTNVYTYLDAFTLDGGVMGAIVGAWATGFVCSWIYKYNRRYSSLYSLSVYCFFCYGCLMTPINNEFIRANTWIIMLISWLSSCVIKHHNSSE